MVKGRLSRVPDSPYYLHLPLKKDELFKLVYYDNVRNRTQPKRSPLQQRQSLYSPYIIYPPCCNLEVVLDGLLSDVQAMRPLAKHVAEDFLVNDMAHQVRVSWYQGGQQSDAETCLDAFLKLYPMDRPITQRYLEIIVVSASEKMADDKLQHMLTQVPQCISVHMIHLHEQKQDTSLLQNPLANARITARCIPYRNLKNSLLDVIGEIYTWHQEKRLHGAASSSLSSDAVNN